MASEILEKLQWRYACKKFDTTRKISEEKIQILKEAFNLTATSYGLQPLKLLVISNQKIKDDLVPFTMDQAQVKECSHVLVLCTETKMDTHFIEKYFKNVVAIRDTPSQILAPFKDFLINDFKTKSQETIQTWMAKQAYLAMGNLLTVCALEDIDACPIEGFSPKEYNKFLNLSSKNLQAVLVLAVGHRASDDMFASLKKVRRGVDDVIITFA